ncbi:hypothetical protein D3C77_488790 [compost metagenome]
MPTRIGINQRIIMHIRIQVLTQRVSNLTLIAILRHESSRVRIIPAGSKILQIRRFIPVLSRVAEDIRNGLFFMLRVAPNVVSIAVKLVPRAIDQTYYITMSIKLIILDLSGCLIHPGP